MREHVPWAFKAWRGVTVRTDQIAQEGIVLTRDEQRQCLRRTRKFEIPRQARVMIQRSN